MVMMRLSIVVALVLAPASAIAGSISSNTPGTLRAAVEDMRARYGDRYPQAGVFLERLERPGNQSGERFEALQREALVANPAVGGQPILFVERGQYRYEHHNTETMFQTGEIAAGKYRPGGALKSIDAAEQERRLPCV